MPGLAPHAHEQLAIGLGFERLTTKGLQQRLRQDTRREADAATDQGEELLLERNPAARPLLRKLEHLQVHPTCRFSRGGS
jgi:hypothetical protein